MIKIEYTLTDGVKNIVKSSEMTNEQKFWAINKLRKIQNKDVKVRSEAVMIEIANEIIENKEMSEDNKYYNLILSWRNAITVCNSYNKPIYTKFNN